MLGEMQAVTKMYDVLKWLLPQVSKLPRSHKFTLGDRITNCGLDVLILLVEANYIRDKLELLRQANTNSRRGGLMVFDSDAYAHNAFNGYMMFPMKLAVP